MVSIKQPTAENNQNKNAVKDKDFSEKLQELHVKSAKSYDFYKTCKKNVETKYLKSFKEIADSGNSK